MDVSMAKRKFTDEITPDLEFVWSFLDPDGWKKQIQKRLKQDKEMNKINKKFKNTSENKMELVDTKINYDKIIDKTEENKKFINDTNDWKSIYDSKKY